MTPPTPPPSGPHGSPAWPNRRRHLMWRLGALFTLISLVLAACLGLVLFLVVRAGGHFGSRPWNGPWEGPWAGPGGAPNGFWPWPALICLLPLAFFVLLFLFGGWTFRRVGSPILDMMAAADAVAEGDLSVRVREGFPGEFGRLASRFNRMTAELARSEQQRRNLTADVAHELRTPLHIIQGNLEGILDGVYEASPEHIGATLEETHLLARLVSDLQTLSLAEAGQLLLHPVRISAADLLDDVAVSFGGQAAEAGVALRVEVTGEEPDLEIEADPDRLDQVLSNLTANALRYTPAGGKVTLRAGPFEDGLRIEVEDTGSGIAPEDLPYIFDRFWRADRARTRREGTGSGLGLAIARQLVQAHGGKIWVESQPGEGTRFVIDLRPASHSDLGASSSA